MELAAKHSLCWLLCMLLAPGTSRAQYYKHVMTSLHMVVNSSHRHGYLDASTRALQLGLGPYKDENPLNMERMMKEYLKLKPQSAESKCTRQINATVEALFTKQDWAIRMVDASGKPPAGFLLANLFMTGSYDECVNITAKVKVTGGQDTIKGQYCRAGFQLAPRQGAGVRFGPEEIPLGDLTLGLCVPNSCSSQDVQSLINDALKVIMMNSTLNAEIVICQPESLTLSTGAIAVIMALSLLGFIIVLGTAYDVFVVHRVHSSGGADGDTDETGPLLGEEPRGPGEGGRNIKYRNYGARDGPEQEVTKTNIQEPVETGIGLTGKLLLAFSLYTNGAKILSTESQKGTIGALNGIRFISMTWVMLGHSYAFCAFLSQNIGAFLYEAINSVSFLALLNATVAVDTFFLLSGLLVGLLTLRELSRAGSVRNVNWVMYYVHRVWRLTPPYMLTLMFYVVLFQYWYNGPFWPQHGIERDYCRNSWWKNILYINNLFKDDSDCMVWSWYLANDMQFYIISPLLLVPLYISGVLGMVVCLMVMLASWTVSGILSSVNNYPMDIFGGIGGNMTGIGDYFTYIYVRPYTRIGPYIVGMLTGYFLHRTGCKVKMPRVVNLVGWTTAAVCCLSVIYGNHDHVSGRHLDSRQVVALYTALHRSVWALGVCWVIFACATGHGGIVNRFLSWSVFTPLSRLTYMAYLIHPIVMMAYYYGMREAIYITHMEIAFRFLAFVVVSYAGAFVLSLAFESPFMGIERALRSSRQQAK